MSHTLSALTLVEILLLLFVAPCGLTQTVLQSADAGFWYLLVRRARGPEKNDKNYYELTRKARFLEPGLVSEEMLRKYNPIPRALGFDIETDHTVRYGVYQAWKVRVVGTSDSQKAPTSLKGGLYILIYSRNRDWIFAAKKYNVVRTTNLGQIVTYTDFQDAREYTMKFSPDWPRTWAIYEVEVSETNVFVDIWQTTSHPRAK